jgi:hypothetical protein
MQPELKDALAEYISSAQESEGASVDSDVRQLLEVEAS